MADSTASSRTPSGPQIPPPTGGEVTPVYSQLLSRLPTIVYVADPGPDGRWHYVSPQIQSILGFSPEEWRADPGMWATRIHPEDRERVIRDEASHVEGEGQDGASQYRMLHRDGQVVWIRDDAVLVSEADGSRRWHGVLSNVTEQKSVEAELAQRARQQAAVARLGEHALEGASPSELMQEVVSCAASILDVEVAGVLELLREENCFVLRTGIGFPEAAPGSLRAPIGEYSMPGYTILSRAPVVVPDWSTETRLTQSALMRPMELRSGASVAIEGRGGPFGVLGVQSTDLRDFSGADIDFLQAIANVLADAIERQAMEDRIRHRSLHDPLTGLPNRVLFHDRLEHALSRLHRTSNHVAILFLDLDRFKQVNDTLGHQAGDELLAAIAPRLKQAVRASDTVARFGGDEFGILLEDVSDERRPVEMAERIASLFTKPFVVAGSEQFITTSIGIAIARGGEQAEDLLRNADAAMYRAKERGSARYELFDEAMRDRAIVRLRIENDLRRAIDADELRIDYQPVVSLRDGRMVMVEALIRWEHPEHGLMAATQFVSLAEEGGMIEPIGRWVLDRACRDGASWHRGRPDDPPLGISVNLSAVQFAKGGLPELVAEVLGATSLDPTALNLEITESVILRDVEAVSGTLRELKALGVRLVLDNFGTGYSSLAYLTRLPLDVLKVDRCFVDGLGVERRDTAIARAIVGIARALEVQTIGEGVENERQVTELAQLGCEFAQGYYIGRPMSASDVTQLLERGALRGPLTGMPTSPA